MLFPYYLALASKGNCLFYYRFQCFLYSALSIDVLDNYYLRTGKHFLEKNLSVRVQCYERYFQCFSAPFANFRRKKQTILWSNFTQTTSNLGKTPIFRQIYWRIYFFLNHNIDPRHVASSGFNDKNSFLISEKFLPFVFTFRAGHCGVHQGDQIGRIFAFWATVYFGAVSWKLHN
jgi:hypothetical protein